MARKKLVEKLELEQLDFFINILLGGLKGNISRKNAVSQLEQIQNYLREKIMQKVKDEKNDIKRTVYSLMMAYKDCDKELNETYYQMYKEIDIFEKKALENGIEEKEINWVDFYLFCQPAVEDIEKRRAEKK